MSFFDSGNRPGSGRSRFAGMRGEAEAYAASLGFTPGGPGWGDAVRDYVLNGPRSDGDPDDALLAAGASRPNARRTTATPPTEAPRQRRAPPPPLPPRQIPEDQLDGMRQLFFGGRPGQPRRDTSLRGLIRESEEQASGMFGRPRQAVQQPQPVRAAPSPPSPRDIVRERATSGVESTSDTDRNPGSTAAGRYQFIGPTFRSYYRQIFPTSRETDAQINERVTDGAIQERVMNAYLNDSERALNGAGLPITPGRLYLLHVAGHPSGMRILRNPDRPIRDALTRDAMTGNPFGQDWTGHDLLEWADGHMNPDRDPR